MRVSGYITMVTLALIWAGYYVANKFVAGHVSVFVIGVSIRALTFLILLGYLAINGSIRRIFTVKGVLPRLMLIGAFSFLLDFTAFMGLKYSSATNAAILLKIDVLFVNIITVVFFKDRLRKIDWFAAALMLSGVFLVTKVDFGKFEFHGFGDLLIIASALFITVNAFIIKSIQHNGKTHIPDELVAFYNNFFCGIIFSIAAFFLVERDGFATLARSSGLHLPLVIAAICQSTLYLLYYRNLRRYKVWLVKLMMLLIPCFGAVLSYFVLHEIITFTQLAGMCVILAGAAIILVVHRDNKRVQGKEGRQTDPVT